MLPDQSDQTPKPQVPCPGGDGPLGAPALVRGDQAGLDLRLPWRVDEFDRRADRRSGIEAYGVYDRAGVQRALIVSLALARFVVEVVNGSGPAAEELRGRDRRGSSQGGLAD